MKFRKVFHRLLVCFLWADQKMVYCQCIKIYDFYWWHLILIKISCKTSSPFLNEETNNLLIFLIVPIAKLQLVQSFLVLVFGFGFFYFCSIFFPRYCSFKSQAYDLWKYDVIVYRQNDNQVTHLVLFIWNVALVVDVAATELSSLTAAVLHVSDVLQFLDHLNLFQLYFAVNQRLIERYLKITQIF